jgi:flagellar hook-associated protein 3 FlgL
MYARVTENSVSGRVLANLQGNLSRLGKLQEQLSSGKAISRPSDSPTGTVSAMQLRQETRRIEQYGRNIDDGIGWLSTIDTALTSSLSQLRRVNDITLQGMSTGSIGPDAREALAVEVENIRASLLAVANTQYLDRPVFGGTTAGGMAYDASGAYQGDAGQVMRTVGDGAKVRVETTGPEVFGTGPNQLFTILDDIAKNLRTNPSALGGDQARLKTASTTIQSEVASIGARYNRLSVMQESGEQRLIELTSQRSEMEDIDLPNTIMELQLQQTAYQAALAATAKVIQPSLVEFLR